MSLQVEIHKSFEGFSLDVDFETDRECMGILGASGCGKSMTLKCVAGIVTPDSGRIILNGRTLYDSEKKINLTPQKRKVGILFQNYALFPHMTVRQNIGIGLQGKNGAQRKELLDSLTASFHLEGLEDHYPRQLSGGQQQRVALARILAYDPDVLMLDEPFSALDTFLKEQLQFEVQKVLRQYRGDVLMVTHSRDEVYRFCDSVVVMDKGRKVDAGLTRELFRNPGTLITARLSGCKNFSRARKTGDYTLWAEDWNTELTTALPVPEEVQAVGIRAHDFHPAVSGETGPNFFRVREADRQEGPFEVSVRMQVNGNPPEAEDRYIWWKIESSAWEADYGKTCPEACTVKPEKVMALR